MFKKMKINNRLKKSASFLLTSALVALAGCSGGSDSPSLNNTANATLKFTATAPSSFVTFESGQVRPLAISTDGKKLFAVNTPDNSLEIYKITATSLVHQHSVPVGMEPVAVAAHANGDVWVVNHLSDSVSIIETSSPTPTVKQTLLVGDEPRDIVFAGTGSIDRAFITTAHRGQNTPYGPASMPNDPGESTLPGRRLDGSKVGRADVWVFNANNPSSPTILNYFTDTPRALAVSPDNSTVYVAGFHTGNQTASIHDGAVCDGGVTAPQCFPGSLSPSGPGPSAPGGLPAPTSNSAGAPAPEVGLIVKFNGSQWVDELNRDWSNQVLFNLPDSDVFSVNANTLNQNAAFSGVGTVLFNMITNPATSKVYVSNTDANNHVRFEGTRPAGSTTSTVVGHLHEAKITVLNPVTSDVTPRHLNKHINYATVPSPAGVKENSLATPNAMAISNDGATLYVAAFGSSKIGIFNTSTLENNSFTPSSTNHITVSGGGPSGLILNEVRNQLYVFTRFDNSISVIDTVTKTESRHYALHNPEPQSVVDGRPFLYDANLTSSNGEASCSSCHVFADFDSLAWELGDPEGSVKPNLNIGGSGQYHPMKGPMTTQSLRGMDVNGPMHWRGDRTAADSGGDPMDEAGAFKEFNVAFAGLVGRNGPIAATDMDAFTNFILQVTYPPNPNRPLDNSKTQMQQDGFDFFLTAPSTVGLPCNFCHVVNPAQGMFGTNGTFSATGGTQNMKIPHLRNLYQKVGMFGLPKMDGIFIGDSIHMGDQIRGFGFTHDGSLDTLSNFHNATLFNTTITDRRNLEQFMHAMDSNLAPIVGQQTTTNSTSVSTRIALMTSQMDAGNNEVIVKGRIGGVQRGWFRQADGTYQGDDAFIDPISETQLLQLTQTAGQSLTFTAVPVGTSVRMAVDRDNDLVLDQNDNCPITPNPPQTDTNNDGVGDACPTFCQGDFDNDGDVDGVDAGKFGADFGRTNCSSSPLCEGDFDNDGDVDGIDASTFSTDFGRINCPIN
jgi:DNA-binding beta-propeller fold protein YncE